MSCIVDVVISKHNETGEQHNVLTIVSKDETSPGESGRPPGAGGNPRQLSPRRKRFTRII